MITVTEQLKNVFEANPLYSKEGQGFNAEVIARFFLPFSSAVWLVTEAEQQEDGDWLFFGYCHIQEWEWGYVLLSQIQEVLWEIQKPYHCCHYFSEKQPDNRLVMFH